MNTTPTPSAKDRVLAWVREKNPQTMEPKFGCKMWIGFGEEEERTYRKGTFIREWIDGPGGYWCSFLDEKDGSIFTADEVFAEQFKKDAEEPVEAEILGSDMGLQELLIALCSEYFREEIIQANMLGDILQDVGDGLSKVICRFDLTQNLHNQSPEFYEALLPLLP